MAISSKDLESLWQRYKVEAVRKSPLARMAVPI